VQAAVTAIMFMQSTSAVGRDMQWPTG
jgi:hypothetical protein